MKVTARLKRATRMKLWLWVWALLWLLTPTANALGQNCPEADPNDDIPDHEFIQACLDRGTEVYLVPGNPGYIIGDKIRFRADDRLLTSIGGKARLVAHPNLDAPLIEVQDANYYEISELILDGNVYNRTNAAARCQGSFPGQFGSNIFVHGVGYKVHHIDTVRAMCGSGLEVTGTNFEIYSVYAAENGRTAAEAPGVPLPWADGITLGICDGGYVHDNTIVDNTDVGLMFFKGNGCVIEHNTIRQINKYAFHGLEVGSDKENVDLANSRVWYNTVDVATDRATYGITVGPHTVNASFWTSNVDVRFNTATGAVVNLAVDGVTSGQVKENTLSNNRGSVGLPCGSSENYTAGHWGSTDLGPGYVCRAYDAGCACVP